MADEIEDKSVIKSLKESMDRLLAKMEAKKWYRCVGCRNEFDRLRPSGKCVFCDPIGHGKPAAKCGATDRAGKVFSEIGIDDKTKAAGYE